MFTSITKLYRPRLALMNGVTAVGGYCLFPDSLQPLLMLAAFSGVTLLAMGGSALNQLLERDIDTLMTRTRLRPLPRKRLTGKAAALAGACAILAGLIPLAMTGGVVAPLLGVAALLWYLALYTPLKRTTSLALPLGALCGAFPPLIGWSLAGGNPADYRIVILAGMLFIWQIPHFWLLQQRHEADYRQAGVPISANNRWLFALWIVALTAAASILPAFGIIARPPSLWLAAFPIPLMFLALLRSSRPLFFYLNLFPVLLTLVLFFRT